MVISGGVKLPDVGLESFRLSGVGRNFFFSLSTSTMAIGSRISEDVLITVSAPLSTKVCNTNCEFVSVKFLPIVSVLDTGCTHFFGRNRGNVLKALSFTEGLLPTTVLCNVTSTVFLLVFTPFTPELLNNRCTRTRGILIFLSPIVLLNDVRFLTTSSLAKTNFRHSHDFVRITTTILGMALGLVLVPVCS